MGVRKTKPAPDPIAVRAAITAPSSDVTQELHRFNCRLVTPMYGGGTSAGHVDTAMPIRATAIRGQLRHWWRLLNRNDEHGKPLGTKPLFEAERAVWGGLGDADSLAASKVAVIVKAISARQEDLQPIARYVHRDGKLRGPDFKELPGYVLFPGQGKAERGQVTTEPGELLKNGFTFEMRLRFDAALDETTRNRVLTALRWWATFGGVGARTRRGCGAVEVTDMNAKPLCVSKEDVTSQGWRLVLRPHANDAMAAWKQAVDPLKEFRQGPGLGRNPGKQPNRPGRSRWPEPDAIRRIAKTHAELHKPEHRAGNVFPRAAFGLPITFYFKDERARDPVDTTLKPRPNGSDATAERMASPLILRPYLDGNRWRPAALCLDVEHIDKMGLSLEGKFASSPQSLAPNNWQAGVHAVDIAPMTGEKEAISAFLAYFAGSANSGNSASQNTARSPQAQVAAGRPKHSLGVAGVRLTLERNGSLKAEHAKTRKSWTARGSLAVQLLETLPVARQRELSNGRNITVDIEVVGCDIVAIREPA